MPLNVKNKQTNNKKQQNMYGEVWIFGSRPTSLFTQYITLAKSMCPNFPTEKRKKLASEKYNSQSKLCLGKCLNLPLFCTSCVFMTSLLLPIFLYVTWNLSVKSCHENKTTKFLLEKLELQVENGWQTKKKKKIRALIPLA